MNDSFIPGLSKDDFDGIVEGAQTAYSSYQVDALSGVIACGTPADYARTASKGRWIFSRHLAIINRAILRMAAREIRRLIVTMPPRHGKSQFISEYTPGWWLGNFPDNRVVITSYGAELAASFSGKARQRFAEFGPSLFGVGVAPKRRAGDDWSIDGHEGSVRSVGVGGPLAGFGADLLIVDDYCKNAEEAHSALIREKTWEWFNSTAYTRLEPTGCIVVMATRWHEDDLIGRLLKDGDEGGEKYHIINLPGIAEEDEPSFPTSLGRRKGEALWPMRFPLSALEQIRRQITERWFHALYQQRPSAQEGDLFKRADFQHTRSHPLLTKVVRFWDLAATSASSARDPDYLVGVKMGLGTDGKYYILDVRRVRLHPGDVEDFVCMTAHADGRECRVFLEQEGGAASKVLITSFIRRLAGFSVQGRRPEGSKAIRAEAFSVQVKHRNVLLFNSGSANWMHDYIDELAMFPSGVHDDQVDASSGAFGELIPGSSGVGITSKPQSIHLGVTVR